ncbi:hypothetical protein QBC46DRAFT_428002 [Diplogelasinospora grovesii]|uniref:Uncharacterized protein n=1 Tax=Diplogelasinospora grovesii TaxID=303347 RepID=A0AAN6MXI2_9PEZI|nr:hypothetical protein QBC46DRAFT_428002 [Diplogelasinospora grovesii]
MLAVRYILGRTHRKNAGEIRRLQVVKIAIENRNATNEDIIRKISKRSTTPSTNVSVERLVSWRASSSAVVMIETDWGRPFGGGGHGGAPDSARKQTPVEVTGLQDFLINYKAAHVWITTQKRPADSPQDFRTKIAILDSGVNAAQFSL